MYAIMENIIYEIKKVKVMFDSNFTILHQFVNGAKNIDKSLKTNTNKIYWWPNFKLMYKSAMIVILI